MTNADKDRFRKLVDHGCIVCKKYLEAHSDPEIHHLRSGVGMGQRSKNDRTIPLCPRHHRTGGYGVAFHEGKKAFQTAFDTEENLLIAVDEAI